MNLENLKQLLGEAFPGKLDNFVLQHENQLSFEIDRKDIVDIYVKMSSDMGFTLISMFASDERFLPKNTKSVSGFFAIYCVFALRDWNFLATGKSLIPTDNRIYPTLSHKIYNAARCENEIYELFGIKAYGNESLGGMIFYENWPANCFPLCKDFNPKSTELNSSNLNRIKNSTINNIDSSGHLSPNNTFSHVHGEGVFEIPVGPVHAGIIEPGHFRFSVAGEPIINLDARLYFVHKGIEKLSEGMTIEKGFYLSERISGDETYTNSLAYCQAIEKAANLLIPERADFTRVIFAELERLTAHLGDLAGICVDVAYGFAAFQFRMLRGWCYQLADELCGMRFLRSVNKLGGIRHDFIAGKEKSLLKRISELRKELNETTEIILSNSMFIDRIENTGILKNNVALDWNCTGPTGRASGVKYDVRKSLPYSAYGKLHFKVPEHNNGDVNCRMRVKLEECIQSLSIIEEAVAMIPVGNICETVGIIEPYTTAIGMTEAPRGENVHWLMIGENNTIYRYKVRTPSFFIWPALCESVKGNIVPDFPLINKSFNLSYAGNDL